MEDLLTGGSELQPVRRAPPPPRLAAPTVGRTQSNGFTSSSSVPHQTPAPQPRPPPITSQVPRPRSTKQKAPTITATKLQHSSSMPSVVSNKLAGGDGVTVKKKAPPPRPPPPKITSRTQRLGGRKHDNMYSGGGVDTTSASSTASSDDKTSAPAAVEAVLMDFSPPPRSPSLAASGSDGLSVNSFGSESSGNLFDAPTSWNSTTSSTNANGSIGNSIVSSSSSTVSGVSNGGFANNFDPFGSIEEENRANNADILDKFKVGSSSFFNTRMQSTESISQSSKSTSLSSVGSRYDSSLFQSQSSSSINWGSANNNSSSNSNNPPDPFSPLREHNIEHSRLQHTQQIPPPNTSPNKPQPQSTEQASKQRSGFRATIIRPKVLAEGGTGSFKTQQGSPLEHQQSQPHQLPRLNQPHQLPQLPQLSQPHQLKSSVQQSSVFHTPLPGVVPQSSAPPSSSSSSSSTSSSSSSSTSSFSTLHAAVGRTYDIMDAPNEVFSTQLSDNCPVDGDVPSSDDAGTPNSVSSHEGTFAVAEYDYDSTEPGDLCLKVGDRVELVAAISSDWLEGRLGGRQGLFPTAFVKMVGPSHPAPASLPPPPPLAAAPPPPPLAAAPPPPGGNQATALYSFDAELPTDLSLQEGSVVTVTAVVEGGQWLLGHCQGRSGQFPANFVSRVPDNLPVVTL